MHTPGFAHLKNFDNYIFESYLAEGGMSKVYKAVHKPTGIATAIKKLKAEFMNDTQIRSKFQSEFVIMKNLDSDNIIKVHDFISTDTEEAYAMELIDGITLKKKLIEQKEIEDEEKLHWMKGLLKALMHIHEKGITHRDIKPGNIFLTKENVIKLGDFGIAKDSMGISGTMHDHTMYAMAPGTFPYISPEQFMMDPNLDHRADIYSAGILMWELQKGEKAFKDSSNSQGKDVLVNHPGSTENEYWDKIVDLAIHKSRDNRYPDSITFLKEIEKLIQDTKFANPPSVPIPIITTNPAPPPTPLVHYLIIAISALLGIFLAWGISEVLL